MELCEDSAVSDRGELLPPLLPKMYSLVIKENSDMECRTTSPVKPPGWQSELEVANKMSSDMSKMFCFCLKFSWQFKIFLSAFS